MITGTIANPTTLTEILRNPQGIIKPGDTIYLRGGVYSGDYVSMIAGTSESIITIQPYQNEKPIIDGSLTINGKFTTWKNIEIKYSGWEKRDTLITGSDPSDVPDDKVINMNGEGTQIEDCIIHDMAGFGFWSGVKTGKIQNCIIYNIGWSAPDRGHGHGIYSQNAEGKKTIDRNIIFNNFATGIKMYAEGGSYNNYDILKNISFQNGMPYTYEGTIHHWWNILAGGVTNIGTGHNYQNNLTYHNRDCGDDGTNSIGWGAGIDGATIQNNYWAGQYVAESNVCSNATITGNTFIGGVPNNLNVEGNTITTFPTTGTRTFVYPNDANTGANIAIYNWDNADSVSLDLSDVTGISEGDSITLWSVQAGVGEDTITVEIPANKTITVDMRAVSHAVSTPTEWTAPPTTFPTFGCFVVEKA